MMQDEPDFMQDSSLFALDHKNCFDRMRCMSDCLHVLTIRSLRLSNMFAWRVLELKGEAIDAVHNSYGCLYCCRFLPCLARVIKRIYEQRDRIDVGYVVVSAMARPIQSVAERYPHTRCTIPPSKIHDPEIGSLGRGLLGAFVASDSSGKNALCSHQLCLTDGQGCHAFKRRKAAPMKSGMHLDVDTLRRSYPLHFSTLDLIQEWRSNSY
ncbi:hypothetical protein VNO77_19170 [Canavalia gladiata]|uniref:Uncharacterized protein n=1 Tax=Canavalia gladiata TaxID=3824 RepID=A0AAN9QL50_CANGL